MFFFNLFLLLDVMMESGFLEVPSLVVRVDR